MADRVTVRNEQGQERQVSKTAAPFFVNQGYVVLDARGHVSASATSAATTSKKES